ncbi:hypothetical protein JCM10212_007162 [Sporobolomyces blumeae]
MRGMGKPGDVEEFTVLKTQPNPDKALELLKTIHSKVKPIMKKHGWVLPTLAEFFPKNPGLLGININRGRKICIRLRPAHDPFSFLPLEEELIGTMLHELTHNHRGPHDDVFFKFLDGLFDEYDALRAKGYTGEGFLGEGHRVGEGVSHDRGLSLHEARERALKRFEEMERVRKVLGTGGKVGGTATDTKGKKMGDLLADAAERRLRAKRMCGGDDAHAHPSGSAQQDLPRDVQDAIESADQDSRSVVIDLTGDDDSDSATERDLGAAETVARKGAKGKGRARDGDRDRDDDNDDDDNERKPRVSRADKSSSPEIVIVSSKPATTTSARTTSRSRPEPRPPRSRRPPPAKRRAVPPDPAATTLVPRREPLDPASQAWTCQACTYLNPSPLSRVCEVCLSPRLVSTSPFSPLSSRVTASRSNLDQRTTGYIPPSDGWICHVCARENVHDFWTCTDCGVLKLSS